MSLVHPKMAAIIPARLHSTRLPEKVLMEIKGKSLVQHVYSNLKELNVFDEIIIATDHVKIYNHVISWGGNVVMTSENHLCGTDRIAEVAQNLMVDYILNVQADEPMLTGEHILPVLALLNKDDFQIGTAFTTIDDLPMFQDPNVVKLVTDTSDRCLYFSRSPIPMERDDSNTFNLAKRHLGIYVFKRDTLLKLVTLSPSQLELCEKLEQLRWLENGYAIYGAEIPSNAISIDTQQDFEEVKALMEI